MIFSGLPRNHFGVILADPPWEFRAWSPKGDGRSAKRHYQTMSDTRLMHLPVSELAARDCALLLWTSGPFLNRSLLVMNAWGFTYKTIAFVWCKNRIGLGFWTRAASEFVLLGTRGKPQRKAKDVPQVVIAGVREHSRKPELLYEMIERLLDGPYVELFARQLKPNWAAWGNEVSKFNEGKEKDVA